MKAHLLSAWEKLQDIPYVVPVILVALGLFGAWILYLLSRKILLTLAAQTVKRTKNTWDDYLYEKGFFQRVSLLVPLVFLYILSAQIPEYQLFFRKITAALMMLQGARVISLFVESLIMGIQQKQGRGKSLSGLLQAIKLLLYILALLMVVAILMDKSPAALLGGIGAMTAIITLVFKDTILSLVASVQFSLNKTLKVGDWIEVPEMGADGDVVDITLHNVMVQNWDKTLITIPTHRFLEQGFKNWKGMSDSGGRRIKRALHIDLQSVRFLSTQEMADLRKIQIIAPYLDKKDQEIHEENKKLQADSSIPVNGKALTNLGVFRRYAETYIESLSHIRKDMTLMVRQLESSHRGVPLQIYCFSSTTAWVEYETIQADIFDHLLASIPYFGLRLFQNPTGGIFVENEAL